MLDNPSDSEDCADPAESPSEKLISERLTNLLVEYQRALVLEGPWSMAHRVEAPENSDSQDLHRAQECLRLLEKVRLCTLDAGTKVDESTISDVDAPTDMAHLEVFTANRQRLVSQTGTGRSDDLNLNYEPAPAEKAGRIGRFEIISELGAGGHGVVLLAYDPVLERKVALKIPRPESLLTWDARQRFAREARITARLKHPHLVPVFEVGEVGPICYIASAYCDGPTLASWLASRSKPIAARRAAEWVKSIAEAVAYAHSQGVLHRDLKPGNILLFPKSAVAREPTAPIEDNASFEFDPQVSDFGLARLKEAGPTMTHSGTVLGTPAYMAPEQAQGHASAIAPTADVYSLGAILYELLTGRPPFMGESNLETLQLLISVDPLSVRKLQPTIPRDIETICLKCLDKKPARRYPTAQALADELERFLSNRPILAKPPTWMHRARLWSRRHPGKAVLLAAVISVVLGLPAVQAWHTAQLQREHDSALAARAAAETHARLARESESRVREHVYAADMRVAQQLRRDGDLASLASILDRYQPAFFGTDQATRATGSDPRGFEWHALDQLRNVCPITIKAHHGEIDALGFCQQPQLLVTSGSIDGKLFLWELPSGRKIGEFPVRSKSDTRFDAEGAALSPDGRRIASMIDSHTVVVWDVTTRVELARFVRPQKVHAIAFSPDSSRIVVGDETATVICDCDTGRLAQSYAGSRLAAFSPDDRNLLTVDANIAANRVRFWDLPIHSANRDLACGAPLRALKFSPDGRMIATLVDLPEGSVLQLFHPGTTQPLFGTGGHGERFRHLGFTADSRSLVAGTAAGTLQFWDTRTWLSAGTLRGPSTRLERFAFSRDDRWLATATPDGRVLIWNRQLIEPSESLQPSNRASGPLAFSNDGATLAVATPDREVLLVDVATVRLDQRLPPQSEDIVDLVFSPDAARLLTSDRHTMRCWDRHRGTLLWSVRAPYATCLAWSPDGNLIASGGTDYLIRLHDQHDGSERTIIGSHDEIRGLKFLPDGQLLISASANGSLRFWDTNTKVTVGSEIPLGAPIHEFAQSIDGRTLVLGQQHGLSVLRILQPPEVQRRPIELIWPGGVKSSLTLTPDGKVLGVGGAAGLFRALRLDTGNYLFTLSGREVGAASAAYAPQGNTLATVSREGCLAIWDLNTWEERLFDGSPLLPVDSIAFSPDGKTLVFGSDDSVEPDHLAGEDSPALPTVRTFLPRTGPLALVTRRPVGIDGRPWKSGNPGFRLWDLDAGQEVYPSGNCTTATAIPKVAVSAAGLIAAGSADGTVWIWNAAASELLSRFAVNDSGASITAQLPQIGRPPLSHLRLKALDSIAALTFSPDGEQLAVATQRGIVQLMHTNHWDHRTTLCTDAADVKLLEFSPNGSILVANRREQLLAWRLQSGNLVQQTELSHGVSSPLTAATFDHSGQRLAVGRADGTAQIHETQNLFPSSGRSSTAPPIELKGHLDRITSMRFSVDDRTLATASWDATVRLWHANSGQEVAELNAHHGKVLCLAFSPDGTMLVSAGQLDPDHGEIFVWRTTRPQRLTHTGTGPASINKSMIGPD